MAGNLLRMLKSQDLAEEALQELFVRIWTNREKLDINQPIRPYMFRIAKNLVFDLYRRAARDQHLREKMLEAMGSSYSHIEEGICFSEIQSELQHVISLLPPKRRKVYVMCKLEAKSHEEVAKLLGISSGTVNDHMKKANLFLKTHFMKHPEWSMMLLAFLIIR